MSKTPALNRGGLIAALDIGSSKIVCLIARRDEAGPQVIGMGHQLSRGVRHGVIVDLDAATKAIVSAVHAAEQMAGSQIERVVVNLSGGFHGSRIEQVAIDIGGREVSDVEYAKVLTQGYAHRVSDADRRVIHSIPVGFSIDGSAGMRDPRGMVGSRLGVNMHVVSADAAVVRNVVTALGPCHLEVAGMMVSPYAAGLSALHDDELELGATLIDLGGGTTSMAVFYDGAIVFADSIRTGGQNLTNDIARGLGTPIQDAERMKALHASALPSPSDERETIKVAIMGESDGNYNSVPKSHLYGIVMPRIEETFELVRNRLESSGFDKLVGRQVVLTGGAAQLTGSREIAGMILDKQVRIGQPNRVKGLAASMQGPAFASVAGLLLFAQSELAEWSPEEVRPRSLLGQMRGWFGPR